MFSTGFSMNCDALAETMEGPTMTTVRALAAEFGVAIAGSFVCREGNEHRNRAFFVTPEGVVHHYDKRHLFRMGSEPEHYSAGGENVVFEYRGWNVMMQVCYDLRFPAWSRNTGNRYDLLIYMANWPEQRDRVWRTLLQARAIENMAYVCGVNRTGTDGMGLSYCGSSLMVSPKGELTADAANRPDPLTTVISLEQLRAFRKKFPAWMDADSFDFKE
jgi:predicted amidohydrolase